MKYLIKFKDDYRNKLNESDSFEKIIGFGFALFVILVGIFVPDEQRHAYSKYINFSGIIILLIISERAKKAKKNILEQKIIIEQQKHLVEEKNREILDSIEYALRIQTAILPPQKIVKHYLENSFILYKPKDIVAGDFYWMETFEDLILFAACDCTGHGVPGAMVSVVCHNAINRAVREFGLKQPSKILDKTAEIVIESFSKSEEEIKDGMDISLCAYNIKTKQLEWSGANNPLWLLQNGELIETKADKQPIGMNENWKPFTNHQFTLNSGDVIYLFTDGYADQFGGEAGKKKLTKKRFKEQVLSIQNLSMQEQGITLDKFIVDYRKEIEQIDDILVMGVKV
ncbi:MAG: SpoIIE family protein phosphatase [Bacteroidia bacterium]|nr:SpoIIE family protein phosphatase [Bacteroidia bacterium]